MTTIAVVMLIMLFLLWRVAPGLSPCTLFGSIAAANVLTFYSIYYLDIWPGGRDSYWISERDYSNTADVAMIVYLFMVALALIAALMVYLLHTTYRLPPRQGQSLRVAFNPSMLEFFNSPYVLAPAATICLCYALLAVRMDWSPVLFHRDYLFLGDPHNLGISDPIFRTLYGAMTPVAIAWSFLTGFYIAMRNVRGMAITLPLFGLFFLITLAAGSRVAGILFAVLAFVTQSLSRRPISLVALLSALWAVFLLYVALEIRNSRLLGLAGIWLHFESGFSVAGVFDGVVEFMATLVALNFTGGYILADALRHIELWYPTAYKVLSFSPLVSAFDGFNEIMDYEHRVEWWIPYSNVAEVYHFGFWYIMFYIVFLGILLCRLQWCWYRLPPLLSLAISGPAYVAMLVMHSYPIRNNFRMFVLSLILSIVVPPLVARLQAHQSRARAGRNDRGHAGGLRERP